MQGSYRSLLFPVRSCRSCWNLLQNHYFTAPIKAPYSSTNAHELEHEASEDPAPKVKKYAYGQTGLEKHDKQAAGLFYMKTIHLPEQLEKNFRQYIKRFPRKVVENDGRKLARHIKNRGRPTEHTWKKYRESRRRSAIERESQVNPDEILKWEEKHRERMGSVLDEINDVGDDDEIEEIDCFDADSDGEEQFGLEEIIDQKIREEDEHFHQGNDLTVVKKRESESIQNQNDAIQHEEERKIKNLTKKPRRSEYKVIRYDKRESVAYAASRLPASFGATLRVFHEISRREPDFKPETLLDFGSGTGSATWAAHAKWGDSIREYQCVDVSEDMNKLAEYLLRGGEGFKNPLHIPQVYFKRFLPVSNLITYDVVVASYALSEIPKTSLRQLAVRSLWGKTRDFLVIIEHGNTEGFEITLDARNMVLKEGGCESVQHEHPFDEANQFIDPSAEEMDNGFVFSPCPHDVKCARSEAETRDHPCNFEQRVELAFCQKNTRLKKMGYYTEKFSFIVLRKGDRDETEKPWPRVLKPVKLKRKHVICKLCCSSGELKQKTFTKKKDSDIYKCARHLTKWGDLLPDPEDRIRPIKTVTSPKKHNGL